MSQLRFSKPALFASGLLLLTMWAYTPIPGLQLCGFHWLTGYECPLCGLTRAMCQMMKGHWQAAIGYHALSPLVLLLILATPVKNFRTPWVHVAVLFLGYGVGRAFLRNSAMSFLS